MIIRLRASITGLAALAALLAIVVGLPVVLYRFGGPPVRRSPDCVRKLHAQVTEFSASRQPYAVIDCEQLSVEETCQAVEAALAT